MKASTTETTVASRGREALHGECSNIRDNKENDTYLEEADMSS